MKYILYYFLIVLVVGCTNKADNDEYSYCQVLDTGIQILVTHHENGTKTTFVCQDGCLDDPEPHCRLNPQ
jgi:hypothetical protein